MDSITCHQTQLQQSLEQASMLGFQLLLPGEGSARRGLPISEFQVQVGISEVAYRKGKHQALLEGRACLPKSLPLR